MTSISFGFKKLSTGSVTLYVLKKKADHPTSMTLLQKAGLRPLKSKEILFLLTKEANLARMLTSRIKWFWLAGRGLNKHGIFKTNHRGELIRIWGQLSGSIVVEAVEGSQPLMLGLHNEKTRFNAVHLVGDVLPDNEASGIVGVPKDFGDLTKEKKFQHISPAIRANREVLFKKLRSFSGVTFHVLKQEADYATALALLSKAGLELFTPQETLSDDDQRHQSYEIIHRTRLVLGGGKEK